MYVLKLHVGSFDEEMEEYCIAVSDDIEKLNSIKQEYEDIRDKKRKPKQYTKDQIKMYIKDFIEKYKIRDRLSRLNELDSTTYVHPECLYMSMNNDDEIFITDVYQA